MIKLENISKSYKLKNKNYVVFNNLNLIINDGESVALLGRNGAGKSTLLRIIGGIEQPDKGNVYKNCNISWPVAMGGVFQGSLSGRENVTFACKMFYGDNKYMLNHKLKYVEEFAEIGEHFDKPIKSYSNGMRMRVAFGLSMAFDFDVYLLDEVSSVGDQLFRAKCKRVLEDKIEKSNFIMVDHNLFGLRVCNKAVVLEKGNVTVFEDVNEGIEFYKNFVMN